MVMTADSLRDGSTDQSSVRLLSIRTGTVPEVILDHAEKTAGRFHLPGGSRTATHNGSSQIRGSSETRAPVFDVGNDRRTIEEHTVGRASRNGASWRRMDVSIVGEPRRDPGREWLAAGRMSRIRHGPLSAALNSDRQTLGHVARRRGLICQPHDRGQHVFPDESGDLLRCRRKIRADTGKSSSYSDRRYFRLPGQRNAGCVRNGCVEIERWHVDRRSVPESIFGGHASSQVDEVHPASSLAYSSCHRDPRRGRRPRIPIVCRSKPGRQLQGDAVRPKIAFLIDRH